jgi:hypothetical protein
VFAVIAVTHANLLMVSINIVPCLPMGFLKDLQNKDTICYTEENIAKEYS